MTERNEIQIDPIDLAAIHVVMALTPEELTGLERLRARIARVVYPARFRNAGDIDLLLYALETLATEEEEGADSLVYA